VDIIRRAIMNWKEYINIEILKLAARHCSGSLIIIAGFSGVTWVARHVMHDKDVLAYVEAADNFVVRACITWLAVVMIWELGTILVKLIWGTIKGGGTTHSILVA
jgi:hypothetical protein